MIQTSIFDMIYPKFKIDKPIRLISLFSGYDSQALALKYLGVPFEHYKTCEWAVKSIQALKDLHFGDDNTDYSKDESNVAEWLYKKGISSNYNEPMTSDQIKRLTIEQQKTIYNNIKASHNLVNIQQVTGDDLEIVETDKYCYILTYSFPCQDLSLAGKCQGMSDTSTRSGMLWEVERILNECKEKPQVLLMENVPQVHGEGNSQDFNKWQLRLEEWGYKNYWEDLLATDYGIPQTRNRCFMISILGEYSYSFPPTQPLKLRLKDLLEDNVSEKYYLSEKGMDYICGNALNKDLKDRIDRGKTKLNKEIAYTLSTKQDRRNGDANFVLDGFEETSINDFIKIRNATAKGYLLARDGDGVNISSRMEHQRGNVQKDKIQTLTTQCDRGVVVNMKTQMCNDLIKNGKVKEFDVIRHNYTSNKDGDVVQSNNESPTLDTRCDCLGVAVRTIGNYSPSGHNASRIVDQNYSAPTVMENHGTITAIVEQPKVLGGVGEKDSNNNTQWKQQNRIYDDNIAISVTTICNPYYQNNLRVRKLIPKECFRLMGVKDEDFMKIAKNQSDSSLYHLAGDSIVVNVLMAIFKEMM